MLSAHFIWCFTVQSPFVWKINMNSNMSLVLKYFTKHYGSCLSLIFYCIPYGFPQHKLYFFHMILSFASVCGDRCSLKLSKTPWMISQTVTGEICQNASHSQQSLFMSAGESGIAWQLYHSDLKDTIHFTSIFRAQTALHIALCLLMELAK